MNRDLKTKVDQSVKLLQSVQKSVGDAQIELCYSGGKDSDVILELAKMAGINYRTIYKCTTIDQTGTIQHCKEAGAEIIRPEKTFFDLIKQKGFPTMRARFCCDKLKEYKILDNAIQGIRRCESVKRAKRYKEPVACRFYGSKKNRVSVVYPILEWTDDDVSRFVEERSIRCHPLYYDEEGKFHVERRLGCVGCPLQADRGLQDFKDNPRFVRRWMECGKTWWDTHPKAKCHKNFRSIYDLFVHNVFYDNYEDFHKAAYGLFGGTDYKKFLEDYFKIELK